MWEGGPATSAKKGEGRRAGVQLSAETSLLLPPSPLMPPRRQQAATHSPTPPTHLRATHPPTPLWCLKQPLNPPHLPPRPHPPTPPLLLPQSLNNSVVPPLSGSKQLKMRYKPANDGPVGKDGAGHTDDPARGLAVPSRHLWLGNITQKPTDDQVLQAFAAYGKVDSGEWGV